MTSPDTATTTAFDADPDTFRERFDDTAFSFSHRLADHPLLQPERLLTLAKEMASDPRDVYYDAGDVAVDQRWDQVPICDVPVDELFNRIETADAWIVLRRPEKFPEYAALLDACIAEIERLSGRDLSRVMKLRNSIVFINSPHRVSSYHIDRECSVLLQIRGRKTVNIFDKHDREVLTEQEIEHFWTVDNNAPRYKKELQERAMTVELAPGDAVHIPVNAPHWVKNGPEVSISLNINFHYRDELLADIYRANYWLRRFGLNPKPPGGSPKFEALKGRVYRSARGVLHRLKAQQRA